MKESIKEQYAGLDVSLKSVSICVSDVNQRPILTPCQRPKLPPLMVSRIRLDA